MNIFSLARKKLEDQIQAEAGDFESYRTLAALARGDHSMLLSDETKEQYKVDLAVLRKKFWDDERSRIIDPLRGDEPPK